MVQALPGDSTLEHSGCLDMDLGSSTSNQLQLHEEKLNKRPYSKRHHRRDGINLARRQDATRPLDATTDAAALTTAAPPDSPTLTQTSTLGALSISIPPTTVQSDGGTSASLTVPILPSAPSGLFDDAHFAPTHSLQPWQIALIAIGAVLILVLLPWFILRRLRRPRPRPRNVDLIGHPTSSMQSQRNRRGGGSAEPQRQYSRETGSSSRWRPVQTLVDFLSFGSGQDNNDYSWRRSYISGATSLSDPPPAYNLHTTTTNINNEIENRRVSAAPTYRSREESRRQQLMDYRQTQTRSPAPAPATNLPMLRLVLPEGGDEWASEFDRELKTPYSLGRFDPDTPTGENFDTPTGGRSEKR